MSPAVRAPAPGDQLVGAVVVRPAAALAQLPVAVAQVGVGDRRQQRLVERAQLLVRGLLGATREEHGNVGVEPFELAGVVQTGARERRHHDRRRALALRREGVCGARLVVVLDEAKEPLLIVGGRLQVAPHRLGGPADEAIVEALVVAEVEALLLQRPLHVPVGLRDEHERGMRRVDGGDDRGPVVLRRGVTGPRAPGAREDFVGHQHRHVTADAVALRRDRDQRVDRRRAQARRECVQLDDVGPRREVGILAVREHAGAGLEEARRVRLEVCRRPADEVVGVLGRPGVVGRDMIGHVVEDQADPPRWRARPARSRAPPVRRSAVRARSRATQYGEPITSSACRSGSA